MNTTQIAGRVGADPDVRFTEKGLAVVRFPVAVNAGYKNNKGDWQEKTVWKRVVVWGNLAEAAADILKKGMPVIVCGSEETRIYEKEGRKQYMTELTARLIGQTILPKKADDRKPAEPGHRFDDMGSETEEEEIPF